LVDLTVSNSALCGFDQDNKFLWRGRPGRNRINRGVGRHQSASDSANNRAAGETGHRSDSGLLTSACEAKAKALLRTSFVRGCTYARSGSCAGSSAHCQSDQSVMAVVSLHESHTANILLVDGVLAGGFVVSDGCVGDAEKSSRVFPGTGVDDLNVLPRRQSLELCPGCLVDLRQCSAGKEKNTKDE
jgi:hypothetical protein